MTELKPYIKHTFNGQIWKLLPDLNNGFLFVETRDIENRQVSFSGFDLNTGKSTFLNYVPDEKWLTGIEGSYNGVLFLHGYQTPQSPVHKGIIAINGVEGSVLWSNYTYNIQYNSINGPIAYNTQILPQKLFLLDSYSGAAIRLYNASVDVDSVQDIILPEAVETLPGEFNQHISGDVRGIIYYMDHNSFRIVSLHTFSNNRLSQILLVMHNSNLVYEDILMIDIQKLQPEAFIVQRNQLVYIKNKVELRVLNL